MSGKPVRERSQAQIDASKRNHGTMTREDVLAERDVSLSVALKDSLKKRQAMIARFGFVPNSILTLTRGVLSNRMFNMQRERPQHKPSLQGTAVEKLERLKKLGVNHSASQKISGRGSAGLSMMPAELVDFFCNYYTVPGDTYLDMFMGQGIRMQVALLRGLIYRGYDMSENFAEYTREVANRVDPARERTQIVWGDSRYPDQIADDSGDFCFTSPPYWDIEHYGDESGQLGTHGISYDDFMRGMYDVMSAWHPKFRNDATIVLNVNDFRKDGLFVAYHADLIPVMRKAGYYLHDIWIISGLVGGMPKAFAVSFNEQQIAPKVHEYALVFKKRAVSVTQDFDDHADDES
jgi:hypothetical protein